MNGEEPERLAQPPALRVPESLFTDNLDYTGLVAYWQCGKNNALLYSRVNILTFVNRSTHVLLKHFRFTTGETCTLWSYRR